MNALFRTIWIHYHWHHSKESHLYGSICIWPSHANIGFNLCISTSGESQTVLVLWWNKMSYDVVKLCSHITPSVHPVLQRCVFTSASDPLKSSHCCHCSGASKSSRLTEQCICSWITCLWCKCIRAVRERWTADLQGSSYLWTGIETALKMNSSTYQHVYNALSFSYVCCAQFQIKTIGYTIISRILFVELHSTHLNVNGAIFNPDAESLRLHPLFRRNRWQLLPHSWSSCSVESLKWRQSCAHISGQLKVSADEALRAQSVSSCLRAHQLLPSVFMVTLFVGYMSSALHRLLGVLFKKRHR